MILPGLVRSSISRILRISKNLLITYHYRSHPPIAIAWIQWIYKKLHISRVNFRVLITWAAKCSIEPFNSSNKHQHWPTVSQLSLITLQSGFEVVQSCEELVFTSKMCCRCLQRLASTYACTGHILAISWLCLFPSGQPQPHSSARWFLKISKRINNFIIFHIFQCNLLCQYSSALWIHLLILSVSAILTLGHVCSLPFQGLKLENGDLDEPVCEICSIVLYTNHIEWHIKLWFEWVDLIADCTQVYYG